MSASLHSHRVGVSYTVAAYDSMVARVAARNKAAAAGDADAWQTSILYVERIGERLYEVVLQDRRATCPCCGCIERS